MASRKPTKSAPRATKTRPATVTRITPAMRTMKALRERQTAFLKRLSADGAAPEVGTIVYVHGIGNKPEASILKCQWDTALFGGPLGDRDRTAPIDVDGRQRKRRLRVELERQPTRSRAHLG